MKVMTNAPQPSFLLSCLLVLWMAGIVAAQAPGTGAMTGQIFDPSGAVIANAHVTAASEATDVSRTVSTNPEGWFSVSLLPPGNYSLVVEAPGFQAKKLSHIHVTVAETGVVNATIEVAGAKATTVDVSARPELAQTETSTLGRVTDEQTIISLPLANRNFSQIIALNPGVVVELPDAGALGINNQNVAANGAKPTSNNFQFNGIDANNLSENSASGFGAEIGLAIPNPDTIEEFKVQTGMFDAGYGRGAGANVDLVSRAGGNRFHGKVWEFFRNDALNANDFFLKRNGQQRPDLKQNQFGGAIGGPIFKDRTFFFASYQGSTQRNGVSNVSKQFSFLPPLTSDRSDASLRALLGSVYGGQSGLFGGTAIAPDGSNINPVALAFLEAKFPNGNYAIPTPQVVQTDQGTGLATGSSVFSVPAPYHEDQVTANLDHKVSSKNQLAGKYFYSRSPFTEPFSPFGANVPGWGTTQTNRNHMFVLSDTHSFSPNLINVARFGFMRFSGLGVIAQPLMASDVGIATPSGLPETPGIVVNGMFTIGTAGEPVSFENTNSFIWQDTVSLTRGRHTFRMGAEAKRHELALNLPFVKDGFLFFLSFPDFLLGQSGTDNGTGVSNLFLSIGSSGNFRKDQRYTDLAGFVQDDIRVNRRLTINAGLRYEYFGPPSDVHGELPTFDPTIALGQVPASGSFSGYVLPANYRGPVPDEVLKTHTNGLWSADYRNLAPRLGFSLRVLDKPTVILRGGYGIYYDQLSGDLVEQTVGQPPFSFKQSFSAGQNSAATFQQPYVPALPPDSSFPNFLPRLPGGGLSLAAVGRNLRSPYVQQYDLNVQTELTTDLVWEIGYVGAKTTHQAGCTEFNQADIATPQHSVNGETTTTLANVAQRSPFAGIAGGSYICQTTFDSNYNSLQTSVTKRMSHGLNLLGSYTWSKNLDFVSGSGALNAFLLSFVTNDNQNPRQARGVADFDREQRFVLSFVYAPPKLAAGPTILRHVLSQWQVSGESVLQSGLPITVTDSTAGSAYGNISGFSRAQCTGLNPASSGSVTSRLSGYLNPAAFAPAPVIGDDGFATGFGNCGVGILRGPSQLNLDLGIQRSFSITEGSTMEFRAEFFNFTNTPKFGLPVSDFSAGSAFGQITTTVANPRIVQFALKYSF